MFKIKSFLIFFLLIFSSLKLTYSATYGSDTTIGIYNPFSISGPDNIIKTFGCVKNGFALQDPSTSCSFQSIFPVAGPISLNGGNLYLLSDLILSNTGTFADLGTIQGANHCLELSKSTNSFSYETNPTGKLVLNMVARTTMARASKSFDWSYDGKYLAIGINAGTGSDLYIYEFTGTSLISMASVNLGAGVNSVRWHPNSYHLAIATTASPYIRSYQYTPPSTLAAGGTITFSATPRAVAWNGRGSHIAIGGTQSTISIYSYDLGTGIFSLTATTTNSLENQIKNNSNAIIKLTNISTDLIRENSNAINYIATHFISINDAKFYTLNGITGASTFDGHGIATGNINLSESTLTINKDLNFDSQITINSSGNFNLQGNAVILGGDINIPSTTYLKFTSNGILDGHGNNLNFCAGSKIIVDTNTTLTLRNTNLNIHASSNPIEMRSCSSKLCLQNSTIYSDRNISFSQGQLFIQNDVLISGTNKFCYTSTNTSYINSNSMLYFDKENTFSYSPREISRHSLSERNLIKMVDKTSSIFFNKCTLELPDSGWQLTKGAVFFDNKITINTQNTTAESFEFGDGTASGDLQVHILAAANINLNGYIYLNTTN